MQPPGPGRLAALICAALLLAGCGGDDAQDPPRNPPPPANYTEPVAYRIDRATLEKLPPDGVFETIEREGDVIAETEFDRYVGTVLLTWLEDHGVDLMTVPRALRSAVDDAYEVEEVDLVVVAREHLRHAERLGRLRPSEAQLRRYFELFDESKWPEAGQAMLEWLGVVRTALRAVDEDTVVVIPFAE